MNVMKQFWMLLLGLACCDSGKGSATSIPSQAGPITVYAASSLTDAVGEVAREWTRRKHQGVKPQFEASSTLARQIQEGAPADLFLSAAPEWIDRVKPLERFDWVSNRLVVVVRKDAKEFDLGSIGSLALANEQVPVGKYAKAALAHLQITLPERIIYGSSVRDVLSKVSQGGASAGIVYATDAPMDAELRIAYTFPPESHPRIVYSAGLVRPEGKALFEALREPWVLDILHRYGFVDLN